MSTTILKRRSTLRFISLSAILADAVHLVGEWRERARQRRHLSEMSERMLADIGISASAARAEASKAFWTH